MKVDPRNLIRDHQRTLTHAVSGARRWQDYAMFYGVPFVAFAVGMLTRSTMGEAAAAGVLAATGLFGAFLFSVVLQVADRAMGWADSHPSVGPETSRHAKFLKEISANAGYAALASTATSLVFVVVALTSGIANTIALSIGLALGVHALLMLLMVVVRVHALTVSRLIRISTGAGLTGESDNVRDLDGRRTG